MLLASIMHECLSCPTPIRVTEEKATLLRQCEESVSAKAEELEQVKLQLEETRQELLLTKNQVCNWAAIYFFTLVKSFLYTTCVFCGSFNVVDCFRLFKSRGNGLS